MLKEFVSVFKKETGKRNFLAFPGKPGNVCKKEKNASSITRILKIRTTTEKIDLAGWVLSEKKVVTSKNLYFEKKGPEVKKHLHLNFLTAFHKTFTFHDYLPQFHS